MELSDVSNISNTLTDVMYRRLKNRERQRRYRERKRQQVDGSNGHVSDQSSQMQIVLLPNNGIVEQAVTRVLCRRNWKKEARRVHAAIPEESIPSGTRDSEQTLKSELLSECNDSQKMISKPGRRDWKKEARNKK